MDRRTTDVLRGIAAAVALLVLVLGIPVGLIAAVGAPWPTVMPSPDQLGRFLTRGEVTSWTLIKALSVAVWLAWLDLTISVVAEAVAFARGRAARRLPGPGVLRMAAANLVASTALLLSSPVRPAAAQGQQPSLTTVLPAAPGATRDFGIAPAAAPGTGGAYASLRPESPSPQGATSAASQQQPARTSSPRTDREEHADARRTADAEGPTWVVGPRDTLWGIAERTLGDGLRWRDIHHLNVGRLQADGQALQPDDDQIEVGWVLSLPPDGQAPVKIDGEQTATGDRETAGSVTVEPGDTLWDLSQEHLDDPFRWTDLYEANAGREQPDGRRLTDPDLIYPGWTLDLPDVRPASSDGEASRREPGGHDGLTSAGAPQGSEQGTDPEADTHRQRMEILTREREQTEDRVGGRSDGDREAPEGVPEAPLAAPSGAGHEEPALRDASADRDRSETGTDLWSELLPIAGAGLVATGIAVTLDRIRRAQRRRRPPGRHIRLPEGGDRETEQRIRGLADPAGAADLLHALVSVAHSRQRDDMDDPLADVVLVSTSATEITFHLETPDMHAPPGWHCEDGGATWVLPRSRQQEAEELTPSEVLSPLLVTVGASAAGQRRVQLNLQHAGILGIDSRHAERRSVMLSFAAELATSAGASPQVVTTGLGEALGSLEWIDCVGDPLDVVGLFERRVVELRDGGAGDLEDFQPVVALIADPLARSTVERLRALVDASRGTLAAVIPAVDGLRSSLARTEAGWRLLPAGVDLELLELSGDELERAGELIAQAKTRFYVPPLVEHDPMVPRKERTEAPEAADGGDGAADGQAVEEPDTKEPEETAAPAEDAGGRHAAEEPLIDLQGPAAPGVDADDRIIDVSDASDDNAREEEGTPGGSEAIQEEDGRVPEVRILGPVTVEGVESWPTAKSQELVVYLAMHRRGADDHSLMEALWPRTEPNRNRLQSEATRARQALGRSPDGQPYLPPAKRNTYRLHPAMRTDYDRFLELARAANDRPDEATELLRDALELVHERPLSGVASEYPWVSFVVHAVEQTIADAAHKLAQLELEQGNTSQAVWAARQGLEADPLFEALYRDLMLAAAQAGNTAEVHAVLAELRQHISEEGGANDADDWIDPETIRLFRELTARGARAGPRDRTSRR